MNKNWVSACWVIVLVSCASSEHNRHDSDSPTPILKEVDYDGVTDDLLTAGLGLKGLKSSPPELSAKPTAQALRKSAYYHNYKALNDLADGGGYGTLFGISEQQKMIAGTEYWSHRQIISGAWHTVVLQVPEGMNLTQPCLLVAPSSGSRHVLGAVGTTGSWALPNRCAVVYTDKGTGTEVALSDSGFYQIDGVPGDDPAGRNHLKSQRQLTPSYGHHVVQVHPYSQAHPERYWGDFVLDATRFGLGVMQDEMNVSRSVITVIAASVSNGGGAVLRAAERDHEGLIDGVVAAEPQVNLFHEYQMVNEKVEKTIETLPLIHASGWMSLLEPCASLHPSLNQAPFKMATMMLQSMLQDRCGALVEMGLVKGDTIQQQAADAHRLILSLSIEPAALQMAHIHTLATMWPAINHTYVNSYLQKSVADNLCQSAMSAFDAGSSPRKLSNSELNHMFALSNGIAPSHGIEVAQTNQQNQIISKMLLAPNMGLSTQRCFHELIQSTAMQASINQILAEPTKNNTPTIIIHGTADGTIGVNHASRAYYHLNQVSHDANQNMRYYEIEHAQHFDAFLSLPGFKERFVPMHPYFEQALDLMLAHLRDHDELPPSQRIKTLPRGENQPLTAKHIPAISMQSSHPITITDQRLVIQ